MIHIYADAVGQKCIEQTKSFRVDKTLHFQYWRELITTTKTTVAHFVWMQITPCFLGPDLAQLFILCDARMEDVNNGINVMWYVVAQWNKWIFT